MRKLAKAVTGVTLSAGLAVGGCSSAEQAQPIGCQQEYAKVAPKTGTLEAIAAIVSGCYDKMPESQRWQGTSNAKIARIALRDKSVVSFSAQSERPWGDPQYADGVTQLHAELFQPSNTQTGVTAITLERDGSVYWSNRKTGESVIASDLHNDGRMGVSVIRDPQQNTEEYYDPAVVGCVQREARAQYNSLLSSVSDHTAQLPIVPMPPTESTCILG